MTDFTREEKKSGKPPATQAETPGDDGDYEDTTLPQAIRMLNEQDRLIEEMTRDRLEILARNDYQIRSLETTHKTKFDRASDAHKAKFDRAGLPG